MNNILRILALSTLVLFATAAQAQNLVQRWANTSITLGAGNNGVGYSPVSGNVIVSVCSSGTAGNATIYQLMFSDGTSAGANLSVPNTLVIGGTYVIGGLAVGSDGVIYASNYGAAGATRIYTWANEGATPTLLGGANFTLGVGSIGKNLTVYGTGNNAVLLVTSTTTGPLYIYYDTSSSSWKAKQLTVGSGSCVSSMAFVSWSATSCTFVSKNSSASGYKNVFNPGLASAIAVTQTGISGTGWASGAGTIQNVAYDPVTGLYGTHFRDNGSSPFTHTINTWATGGSGTSGTLTAPVAETALTRNSSAADGGATGASCWAGNTGVFIDMPAVTGFGCVAYDTTAYKMADTSPAGPVSVNEGDSPLTFSVVSGGSSLSYQWMVDTGSGFNNVSGVDYSGATTATLTIDPTTTADSGTYECVVTQPSVTGGATWTSTPAVLTVNSTGKVTPAVAVTDNKGGTMTCGDSVTFTATLTGGNAPTGTVQFQDGANNLGTPQTVSGGPTYTATLTTSALARGSHTITAAYSGDSNNNPVNSSGDAFSVTASGSTSIWNGGGTTGNFSDTGNWVDGGCLFPDPAGGYDLQFDGSARPTPNLEANYVVASLTFNSTIGASFNIGSTGGKTLSVGAAGITNNSSGYDQTISASIAQGTVLLVVETGSRQLLLSGDVEGSGGYTVNGAGTLFLNNSANGIGGPTIVNTGATLRLSDVTDFGDNGYAYGNDTLTLDGGTLRNDDADTSHGDSFLYWAVPCTLGPNGGAFNIPNPGALLYGDGTSFRGTTWHPGKALDGLGQLTKSGIGTLIMTNSTANTYQGGTFVQAGTLVAKMDNNLGSGDVTVASGATFELTAPTQFPATSKLLLQSGSPLVVLNYSGANTVAQLSFDGGATFQAAGTWGSSASGATYTDDTRFSGTGQINVTTGPAASPTPVASFSISSAGGGSLTLDYSGGTGAQFVLLQTNNVAAPLANWTRLQTNTLSPGSFTVTPGSDPAEFYRVKSE